MKSFQIYTLLVLSIILSSPVMAETMVEVPDGFFTMGHGDDTTDSPEKRLFLEAYRIDSREVTNREYAEQFPDHTYNGSAADHPITRVTWYQADAYCQAVGKRLPSEAEWEKAARGELGNFYPWGNKKGRKPPHPFYSGVVKRTAASNKRDVSPYGVHDMAGSVWEWTGGEKEEHKVARGGLWNLHLDFEYSKTYERAFIPPNEQLSFLGFRCAQSLE